MFSFGAWWRAERRQAVPRDDRLGELQARVDARAAARRRLPRVRGRMEAERLAARVIRAADGERRGPASDPAA